MIFVCISSGVFLLLHNDLGTLRTTRSRLPSPFGAGRALEQLQEIANQRGPMHSGAMLRICCGRLGLHPRGASLKVLPRLHSSPSQLCPTTVNPNPARLLEGVGLHRVYIWFTGGLHTPGRPRTVLSDFWAQVLMRRGPGVGKAFQ